MKNQPFRTIPSQRRLHSYKGFTLVELLIVIVIIAVLAALTLSLTRKIKAKAYQANALSSLRQVAAFSMAYSTENNGDINTMRWEQDPLEGKPSWIKNTFWGRLQPYIFADLSSADTRLQKDMKQRLDLLFSTSTTGTTMKASAIQGPKIYRDKSGLMVPFSFNANLYKWNTFIKTTSVRDTSQVLYAVYGRAFFSESNGQSYVPMVTDGTAGTSPIYYLDGGKVLGAFVDGHIETLTAPIEGRRFE